MTGQPSALLVGNFLSHLNGRRSVCEGLAERLASRGWTLTTTSPHRSGLLRGADMAWSSWKNRERFRSAYVEVFSGRAFLWAEAVTWVLRRVGCPYVLALHGGNLPSFATRWPGRVRRLLQSAEHVTVPCAFLHDQMRPYRKNLLLMPNAIDLAEYRFRPRTEPRPALVWVRALHRIYNPGMAIRVLAILSRELPGAHLDMLGPDKRDGSWQETRNCAQALGVTAGVRMPGGVPPGEVASWLDRSDIFINTSDIDNTPLSVLEAMACGLCVVTTNSGGMPYLLHHERDALLVPAGDPDAMANAVRRILTEPGLAEWLSRNARRTVEAFDWSIMLPRWEELLERTNR
jgi:glycosyltransferase involved in cell wall biosynthesis